MYHHEIDCCNGLSLCDGAYGSGYVVVNLATRQHFSIPEPLKLPGWNFAAIVFGPIQSNDYTIVRPNPYYDTPSLDIFSSEIGKWVRHIVPGDWVEHLCIREFGSPMLGIKWAKGNVYLDGMLYLLIRGKHLVQFDLKSLAVSAEVIKVPCGANGHGKAKAISVNISGGQQDDFRKDYPLSNVKFLAPENRKSQTLHLSSLSYHMHEAVKS
ncbi:hypothetical protein C5167_022017 [Papaver somniferum]|uniref:Uncharacterized protein n=1 Tax=Papaver somniferum TaxID=3469 RepID=A0A4Y7JI93_PAPSO|nr:hypothetical protein C5167_022017 [Papaver somniferum]